MGGAKKKSPAQQEKTQTDEDIKKSGKKGKKKGDKKSEGGSKAEISVILSEEDGLNAIKGAKVITKQELARQTGVKISTANAFLRKALEKGFVKKVGGHSGHHIYQPSA